MKKRFLRTLLVIGFLSFVFYSCDKGSLTKEQDELVDSKENVESGLLKNSNGGQTAYSDGGTGDFVGYTDDVTYISTNGCPDYGVYQYTLWAGKTNNAGTVTITNDGSYLYVTYDTNGTADLEEAHVYVWTDMNDIPSRRPAPGQAPYVAENINADSYTFMIPLSDFDISELCGSMFYISTHAALIADGIPGDDDDDGSSDSNAGETAYAGGSNVPDGFPNSRGAWWGYVTYIVECYYNISGTVYDDADNSFDMESGEMGFEGITVYLLDASNNVIASTMTAADGSYLFEHVAGGMDYTVIVMDGPVDYVATENAGGFSIMNLNSCITDVDFGFYKEEDDDDDDDGDDDDNNNNGGDGTGALSFVSFATGCSDSVTDWSTGGDFVYNVELDYQQTNGTIKFEAVGDQLGEDGEQESDTFSFNSTCDVSEITVTTKNQDTESHVFTLGESHDMGNGFTVVWVSKVDNGGYFTYTFTVTSDNIGGGGN